MSHFLSINMAHIKVWIGPSSSLNFSLSSQLKPKNIFVLLFLPVQQVKESPDAKLLAMHLQLFLNTERVLLKKA